MPCVDAPVAGDLVPAFIDDVLNRYGVLSGQDAADVKKFGFYQMDIALALLR